MTLTYLDRMIIAGLVLAVILALTGLRYLIGLQDEVVSYFLLWFLAVNWIARLVTTPVADPEEPKHPQTPQAHG